MPAITRHFTLPSLLPTFLTFVKHNADGMAYEEDPGVAAARAFFRKAVKAKKAKKMKASSPKHKKTHGTDKRCHHL